MAFRSGFAAIIGRPNAGKSTLLNALVGEKLAIVTPKPQTTRNRIQGMINLEPKKGRAAGQIVLIDTPGIHRPDSRLGRTMMQQVYEALEGCDLLLLIVDASQPFGTGDQVALQTVKRAARPVFLLLNKIDLIDKRRLLPTVDEWRKRFDFAEIIPLSALKRDGLELLLEKILARFPEGPRYFPKEQVTDQPERFLAAEIVREQILRQAGQEVPYATAVVIERYQEKGRLISIAAIIYCEREGQKAILIGRAGQMLKKIGTAARQQLERRLNTKIFLELFVKVRPGWRDARDFVEALDWRRQLEDLGSLPPKPKALP